MKKRYGKPDKLERKLQRKRVKIYNEMLNNTFNKDFDDLREKFKQKKG